MANVTLLFSTAYWLSAIALLFIGSILALLLYACLTVASMAEYGDEDERLFGDLLLMDGDGLASARSMEAISDGNGGWTITHIDGREVYGPPEPAGSIASTHLLLS